MLGRNVTKMRATQLFTAENRSVSFALPVLGKDLLSDCEDHLNASRESARSRLGVAARPLAVANGSRSIVEVISKMRRTARGPGIIVSSQFSC